MVFPEAEQVLLKNIWICMKCNARHRGLKKPEKCRKCGSKNFRQKKKRKK
jgi:ribosomal protein L40E